jgi:glycine betaine/proline transport system substrate-binding protein
MASRGEAGRRARLVIVVIVGCALMAACGGGGRDGNPKPPAPTPSTSEADCGTFTIAYDPANGYEASAFIIGTLAKDQLGCDVRYVKTTSRNAWRTVARGDADVYLDAYGNEDLRRTLAGDGGPVTIVGPNGVKGGVDLLAPEFMGDLGLATANDLPDMTRIGWGITTPAITTSPELVPLAQAFIDFQNLSSYVVRNSKVILGKRGMRFLLPQPAQDDARHQPNLYMIAAPRALLGDAPGRVVVDIPESAAEDCVPDKVSTLCSLVNFQYQKIVNSDFAQSDSPAYTLVYNYELDAEDAATVEELVSLSGYNVGPADVASWLNTHKETWSAWLPGH